jgi:hypothetical protein
MSGRPDRLRLGDVVRFQYQLHTIVGFDGTGALLRTDAGATLVVTIAALVGDGSFEVIGAPHRRRPLVPSYFESLPAATSVSVGGSAFSAIRFGSIIDPRRARRRGARRCRICGCRR